MRLHHGLIVAVFLLMGCGSQKPSVDVWTASAKGNIAELQLHIAAGTDLNEKEPMGGGTPLITACTFNQPEAAKLLIEKGADLEIQNNEKATALTSAVFFCYPEIVTLLLENGADVNIQDKNGSTPMDVAGGPWSPALEGVYKYVGGVLKMEIDIERIKKVRPEVAAILKKHGGKFSSEL